MQHQRKQSGGGKGKQRRGLHRSILQLRRDRRRAAAARALFRLRVSAGGEEVDAQKGHGAAEGELGEPSGRGALKVAVQDGAADDDGDGEEHKLRRDDLGRAEALQRPVDVPDLQQRARHENRQQQVRDRERQETPESMREERGYALGRKGRVGTYHAVDRLVSDVWTSVRCVVVFGCGSGGGGGGGDGC